jgi:predicted transcriptional regulator YheO
LLPFAIARRTPKMITRKKTSPSSRRGNAAAHSGAGRSDADLRLATLAAVLEPMATTFGEHCEIVLHDYRRPDHSVVAVAGNVTHRKVGSAMSEIGLSVMAEGDLAEDRLNYLAATPAGRIVKSSTIVLRDSAGRMFGALCINLDITELRQAAHVLAGILGEPLATPSPTTFVDDIRVVIDTVLAEQLSGRAAGSLTRRDRLDIFRALDARGVFGIKRGLSEVAERLGISRATGYTYLQQVRGAV